MTRHPALPEKLAAAAHDELESLGVRKLVDTRVTEVDRKGVHTGDGELVPADIRVWAAGIRGADILEGIGGLETTRSCRRTWLRPKAPHFDFPRFRFDDG